MRNTKLTLYMFLICLTVPVLAEQPSGSVYLEGSTNSALILAHGKGKHPTWLVVNPVRKGINKALGYHTLSLQMPTGHDFWEDYADDFPAAYATIDEAIDFLRNEKNIRRIYLMGHSMGSRMMSAYVAEHPQQSIAGLIIVGCRNNGPRPLSCDDNLQNVSKPVLDIWGGADTKDYASATAREHFVSKNYQQVQIDGARHRFNNYEEELVSEISRWLQQQ